MEKQCYTCKSELVLIPAGVSKKTNERYDAFWSCPKRCRIRFSPKTDTFTLIQPRELNKEKEIQELIEVNKRCLKAVSEFLVEIKKFIGQE